MISIHITTCIYSRSRSSLTWNRYAWAAHLFHDRRNQIHISMVAGKNNPPRQVLSITIYPIYLPCKLGFGSFALHEKVPYKYRMRWFWIRLEPALKLTQWHGPSANNIFKISILDQYTQDCIYVNITRSINPKDNSLALTLLQRRIADHIISSCAAFIKQSFPYRSCCSQRSSVQKIPNHSPTILPIL